MPQTRLGALVPYDTPPPPQGNTQTHNTQTKAADKGSQVQKRKRAGSKTDKDPAIPPPGSTQTQKKARTTITGQEGQDANPSPAIPQSKDPNQLHLRTPSRDKTPQPFSLPENANRNSPSPPPSPTDEARKRKKAQTESAPPSKHPNTPPPINSNQQPIQSLPVPMR